MPVLTVENGTEIIRLPVKPGETALDALRGGGYYPAAVCGGRGNCGKCALLFLSGATPATDEDRVFFTKSELDSGMRLACRAELFADAVIAAPTAEDVGFNILTRYKRPKHVKPDRYALRETDLSNCSGSLTEGFRTVLGLEGIELRALRRMAGIINPGVNGLFGVDKLYALTRNGHLLNVFTGQSPDAFGIAIDIGTTTICFELLRLPDGEILSSHSCVNSQRRYGADVISRITAAADGLLDKLGECVRGNLLDGIKQLLRQANVNPESVYEISIAANTTMTHILLGIQCESLGTSPFTPTLTDPCRYRFVEIFSDNLCDCEVSILPAVSAYVGGDITAGIYFCGGTAVKKTCLFVDLGTNGEMALLTRDHVLCASTAAGPAFEGGNISCGMGGVPGAISKIRCVNGGFACETIAEAPPIGICGSGLMDAVRALLTNGMIDETGLLADEYFESGAEIAPGIFLTQRDIRELQLAKSAIRAGIEALLDSAGLHCNDIEALYIAGSFGYNMDIESAAAIGLIPDGLLGKAIPVGNSSLGGCAASILENAARVSIAGIAKSAIGVNLSKSKVFSEQFMGNMYFPTAADRQIGC